MTHDLLKCLAFDAITAWRVFDLQRLAKYERNRLASEFFDATEIRLLRVLLHSVKSSYDIRPPPNRASLTLQLAWAKLPDSPHGKVNLYWVRKFYGWQ